MLSNRLVMQQVLKIREWPPKPMPSSRCRMKWILVCLGVSARFLHGFCTDFARFQNVQRVQIVAKLDKGCRNCWVKNYVALIKNNDNSKLPETETNRRLALLISGPRVRVPGGSPDIERQIVRFGVLFCVGKQLHTFCTPFAHLPESGAFLRKVCTACFPLHKKKKF